MKHIIIIILIFLSGITYSQEPTKQKLTVFFEGRGIDFNYIRNNINFVDFLNDSKSADLHVIVSRKRTGSGGREYTLAFYGKNFKRVGDITLSCYTYAFDSQVQTREKLTNSLKAGLLPYVNEHDGLSSIEITSKKSNSGDTENEESINQNIDPWRNWVFSLGLSAGFDAEEQRESFDYSMNIRIRKITKKWKFQSYNRFFRRESTLTDIDDGVEEIIKSLRQTKESNFQYIYSLNEHWSSGLFLQGSQSTYINNKMSLKLVPALQYNFFAWKEIDRRSFTLTYKIGPSYNEYYETTILGLDNEWLWSQSMDIRFETIDIWGDLEIWLEGGHFFPDFDHYYYRAGFEIAFRISKGLSFTFDIEAQNIHNQRYLPESDLSLEDLLLNNRKPPTEWEFGGDIGIRFQFGSLYNNIVNERL